MRAGELIRHIQTLLGDPTGDYHTTEKMLLHLNTAVDDIGARSRTLCTWHFEPVQEGRGMYGLPENFLAYKYVAFFYQGELCELTPGNTRDTAPAIFRDPQQRSYRIPHTYAHAGNAFIEKLVATVIENPVDRDADNSGEVRFWSSAPAYGVNPGDRLINFTDNSEGYVTALAEGFSQITFEQLANGEANRMQVGDEFRILSRTEHRHTIAISPPPQITDEIGDESLYIYLARQHIPIREADIDKSDDIELDTEFNSALRHRVMYYASLEERGIDHPSTISYDVKYETDYMKAFPKANNKIKQYISHWRRNRRQVPRIKTLRQTADFSVKFPFR